MLGVYLAVPIACFRKGLAREYLETEPLPPPATAYGFLLSLVGEERRARHLGCRVCPVLLSEPGRSVVLRTVWRVKKQPLGSGGNTRPDYQQLLTHVELAFWLDSAEEEGGEPSLERRVERALADPASVTRYGGLCLGESTHLVDEVRRFPMPGRRPPDEGRRGRDFVLETGGRLALPVWVDHVGSAGTRHVTGNLVECEAHSPPPRRTDAQDRTLEIPMTHLPLPEAVPLSRSWR
jgi:CRISPR-associated protein Cas5t